MRSPLHFPVEATGFQRRRHLPESSGKHEEVSQQATISFPRPPARHLPTPQQPSSGALCRAMALPAAELQQYT